MEGSTAYQAIPEDTCLVYAYKTTLPTVVIRPNIGNTIERFDGVHAFGYNSAESEPI